MLYYEDQKEESLKRAEEFRASRIPKFLKHFQAVLESNKGVSLFIFLRA